MLLGLELGGRSAVRCCSVRIQRCRFRRSSSKPSSAVGHTGHSECQSIRFFRVFLPIPGDFFRVPAVSTSRTPSSYLPHSQTSHSRPRPFPHGLVSQPGSVPHSPVRPSWASDWTGLSLGSPSGSSVWTDYFYAVRPSGRTGLDLGSPSWPMQKTVYRRRRETMCGLRYGISVLFIVQSSPSWASDWTGLWGTLQPGAPFHSCLFHPNTTVPNSRVATTLLQFLAWLRRVRTSWLTGTSSPLPTTIPDIW
jgi:hypothetical protein